jgi:hypothetical protein
MLDNLGNRASSMPSLTQFATWLKRDARRVARLPILNVDPDLVKWGEEVAMRLSEGAQIYTVGGLTVQTRAAGVMDTASENRWIDTSEEHYSTNQNDVNRRNAMAMRRAASKEEQAKVAQAVSGIVNDLMAKRLEIRKVLTQRYKVEFK